MNFIRKRQILLIIFVESFYILSPFYILHLMVLKRLAFLLFILANFSIAVAQDSVRTEWASRVLYSTSAYASSGAYSVVQILGRPNSLSFKNTASPIAWAAKKDGADATPGQVEVLKVGFKNSLKATQVAIVENFNPGAIIAVIISGTSGESDTIYSARAETVEIPARTLNIFFKSRFEISELELHLHTGKIAGWNQIDAIGISTSADSLKSEVNPAPPFKNVVPENLGNGVNTVYSEIAPVISPDGKTLYFNRKNDPQNLGKENDEDIWFSEYSPQSSSFLKAVNIGAPLNNTLSNFACSITPDGSTMLLADAYTNSANQSAAISKRTANGWSIPQAVKIVNFYNRSRVASYSLSADNQTLLMCVERDGGSGNLDMYVSFLKDNNEWSEPQNLGRDVNTAGQEATVFLAADGATIFFSSNGHNGYGDNDIFMSQRLDSTWTRWSEPQNLGASINSAGWDAYYSTDASGVQAYFVSENNSLGKNDIFKVKLPPSLQIRAVVLVRGKVFNAKTKEPLSAQIIYESLEDGKTLGTAQTNPATGEYQIVLTAGKLYGFRAQAEKFIAVSQNIDLTQLAAFKETERNLALVPIEVGQTIVLNNLFFDYNETIVRSESYPELNRVAELLKQKPEMRITIKGHTDNVGGAQFNQVLSGKRAQAVAEYLFSQGANNNQVSIVGLGASQPVAKNDTEENRAKNRRVEFTIDK
ncbi:MAG: OmpA family protein [Bacteroidota bacterium]